ncbi:MAG: Ig-like domain-containing protein [Deltaproteobacteria bacterium]|nr:Ig-like domain-containing protein [Deltaproteobacteria bacterium]
MTFRSISLLATLLIVLSVHCGGGGGGSGGSETGTTTTTSTPTVSSLKVDGSAVASSGTTIFNDATLAITFSDSMNATTVTTSTVTLTDSSSNTVTSTISAATDSDGTANNEFTLDPTPILSPNATYTVTIEGGSTGVKNSAGTALSGDTTYSVQTKCASDDDFSNVDTASCYTFRFTSNHTNESGASEQAASITTAGGQVVIDMGAVDRNAVLDSAHLSGVPAMYKRVSGDFDLQLTVVSATIEDGNSSGGIGIESDMTGTGQISGWCARFLDHCGASLGGAAVSTLACTQSGTSISKAVTMRLLRAGNILRCYYKQSGESDFTLIGSGANNSWPSSFYIMIYGDSNSTSGTNVYTFDDFQFSSGNAIGQSISEQ